MSLNLFSAYFILETHKLFAMAILFFHFSHNWLWNETENWILFLWNLHVLFSLMTYFHRKINNFIWNFCAQSVQMVYKNAVINNDNSIWFISSNYLTTNWINEALTMRRAFVWHQFHLNWYELWELIWLLLWLCCWCCFCSY